MNRIALDLGFIQIYWYSIFILLGVFATAIITYYEAKKQGMESGDFTDLLFNTVIFGIVGARIYYVLFNLPYYLNNKIEILEIWHGGLAIHGGIIGGFLYVLHFCKKRKYNLLKITDMIVVGLILGQAIGRWGNFFNQEAYGPLTSYITLKNEMIPGFIINGMKILGQYYEPTFYYESLWNLDGFLILLMIRKSKNIKVGQITGSYFIWYSLGRIYIEYLRMDSLMLGNFKVAQIVSIVLIVVGILLIIKDKITKKVQLYHNKENLKTEQVDPYATFEAYKHKTT